MQFYFIPKYWDYQLAEFSPSCGFFALIPSREAWEGKTSWRREAASFSTDESKFAGMVGGGLHCLKLTINSNLRFPNQCSVGKVEVTAIKVAVDLLLRSVGVGFLQSGYYQLR